MLYGLYEYQVMPFELCMGPATIQWVTDTVLVGHKWRSCLVYLDDAVVLSGTFLEPVQQLMMVLEAIRKVSLSPKAKRCPFKYNELKFLGHIVSATGIRPNPEKTSAITNSPMPKNKKQVPSFLELCSH